MSPPLLQRVGGAHICHQIARGQNVTNIGARDAAAVGAQDIGTGSHAFRRQRDIIGDDHIIRPANIGNPHVGRVRSVIHDHKINQRVRIGPYATIADHDRPAAVANGDGGDLVFHRTGVCIHVNRHDAPTIDQPTRLCIPPAWTVF